MENWPEYTQAVLEALWVSTCYVLQRGWRGSQGCRVAPHQAANGLPLLVGKQDTVGGAADPGDLFIEL